MRFYPYVETWQLIEHPGPPRMLATAPSGLIVVNPALSPDGRMLFFCGMATSKEPPRLVDAVSSPDQESSPWLSSSGNVMLFSSNRPGGIGGWDLYVARKSPSGWLRPQNLGAPVNTPADETGPTLSSADTRLFFLRNTGGTRKVYSATLRLAEDRVR
jgi:WD40-like Beta Propeller Repeat